MRAARLSRRDHLIGLGLCLAYVLVLLPAADDVAMSRDEGFYVDAADDYAGWLELLGQEWACEGTCHVACEVGGTCPGGRTCPDDGLCALPARATCSEDAECGVGRREIVDHYWGYNHEHPSLAKGMFAFFRLLDMRYALFERPTRAYRLFGMLTGGLLLWLIYVFGVQTYGRSAGLFAALAFATMPRVFYHAQLDAFDVPVALMGTLVTYCYWRAVGELRWVPILGVAYGLALATKHNAWLLPPVFLIHFAFVMAVERAHRRRGGPTRIRSTPWWLLGMLLLGPPIFIGLWPWMWFDTVLRFGEYAGFHLNHDHYNMAYFGVNYFGPPLPVSYPWVMTAITVSATTLVLAVIGIAVRFGTLLPPGVRLPMGPGDPESDPRRTDVLFIGSMLAPIVVISMPWTPIFGGTKHWFLAYPFLALFAGRGFTWLVQRASSRPAGKRPWLAPALAVLLLAPGAVETWHSHPFGLSHYTSLAGGPPGAADLGMNRQFWGFTTGSLVDWFNREMPEGGSVWICDMTPTAWRMMQEDGRLNRRIRASASLTSADYAIVHHEDHFVEVDYQIWEAFGSVQPVKVLTYDGVPIISVYENPNRR